MGFGWQLMLGQRLSNEQSNVGPTKYVAVGPTLNQRLGFGWRMVSVLAGKSRINRKGSVYSILQRFISTSDLKVVIMFRYSRYSCMF